MEPLGIYSPISGITTNQSESFNALLKRYGQWREAPLDSMVLGLYFLQSYHHNEIQRGYGGIGSYTLFSEYTFAAIPLDEVITSTVISPEEIVDKIKNNQIRPASTDSSQFTSAEELDHWHLTYLAYLYVHLLKPGTCRKIASAHEMNDTAHSKSFEGKFHGQTQNT